MNLKNIIIKHKKDCIFESGAYYGNYTIINLFEIIIARFEIKMD